MSRLDLLVSCVFILSLVLIQQYLPRNDGSEKFFQGLEKFAVAAENHLAKKPIPDVRDWRSQRIQTIKTLNELRQKLDNVCFYSNCGKAAGSGMGVMCALTSIAATLLGILLPLPVMSVGGFMCPSAFITKEASSIMESVLSAKYLNELQAVLRKDENKSRSLEDWLTISQNLEGEFQKIFDFGLKSNYFTYFNILSEFSRLFDIYENFNDAYDIMKRGKYSEFLDKDITIYNLCLKFSIYLENYPHISDKIQQSLSILDGLSNTNEYIRILNEKYQNSIMKKMVITTSILRNMLNIKIPHPSKVYVSILLNVLNLIKEVTSFREATKIIVDGKCPYSDGLKHIIDMLELELTIIESSFSI